MKGENCPGHPLCQSPTIDTWKKQRAENHRKPREGSTELPGANSYNISWSYKAVPTNGPYGPYKALYGNPVISDSAGAAREGAMRDPCEPLAVSLLHQCCPARYEQRGSTLLAA